MTINEAVSDTLSSFEGIETTASWLQDLSDWRVKGKVLATYQKGKEDPTSLLKEG